ncbi:Ger(x)C family spore germination protein [Aquibacillus sp. 3ASR75-11]|uniref:Ger(X)C family spore germination protein n=1 Tax=Terrihalobacillus insolitus TaxID=2950438 RepID=A0A9X3WRY7_9BACI|nr:Ger(x)C family spore germination protein [Terrihalobacillus insolitus]MDC3424655.1 Ger(x)C family spore germination protein [Terrihalobacillus insolitus]
MEIEQRGFVVGVAIDLAEEQSGGASDGDQQIELTLQLANPRGLGSTTTGGGQQKAFLNISGTGSSIFEINRDMAKQTSRTPFYEHLKVIIVSKELAQKPGLFSKTMDTFIRDPEMRRSVKVLVAEGKSKNFLNMESEQEKLPSLKIESIIKNTRKNASIIEPVRIGKVHQLLLNRNSYVLPTISLVNNKLKDEGVAVLHGKSNVLVGTLNKTETKGLNFIKGETSSGVFHVNVDGDSVIYEIVNAKSKIQCEAKSKDDLKFTVSIEMEGNIAEDYGSKDDLIDERYLKKVESKIEQEIKNIAQQTIDKVQKELKVDVLGFDRRLRRTDYDLWEQVRKNWDRGDNYFAKSDVNVEANAIVRITGVADQTKSGIIE